MKALMVGIGAAGNKAVMEAVDENVVKVEDTIIINSTSKDFPADYKGKTIQLSPQDTGCGKERNIAYDYAYAAIQAGKFNIEEVNNYTTVVIVTSVEGGTGSGSTPLIAKFFNQVFKKNVHIIAFIGFEDDVRGMANTVDFFKEIDSNLIVHAIRNSAFLRASGKNKFKAEVLANKEMCKHFRIITGQQFIASGQNIDDTDILKVSNTAGYMTVEEHILDKALVDQEDFNRIIKKMVYESASVKSQNPGAARIGVILNIDKQASEDAIDYEFKALREAYGEPYELFLQDQWDGKDEYIQFIISGMKMPVDELEAVYNRYKEASASVNKDQDEFFEKLQSFSIEDEDKRFDMIKPAEKGQSVADFLSQFK